MPFLRTLFSRIFPLARNRILTEQVVDLQAKVLTIQSENVSLKDRCERYLLEALHASQAVTNWLALRHGRLPIVDGLRPTLPLPPAKADEVTPTTIHRARSAVISDRRRFLEEYAARLAPESPPVEEQA